MLNESFLYFSVDIGAFVIGQSQISSFSLTLFAKTTEPYCWIFPIVTSDITSSVSFAHIMLEKS